MKKLLCFIVSLLMISTTLSGCSQSKKVVPNSTATGAEDDMKNVINITWSTPYPSFEGSTVQKKLEEKFNVKITPISVTWSNMVQQYQTRAASQDLPDVFQVFDFAMFQKFADQGVLAEVPMELYKKYMPHDYQVIEKFDPNLFVFGQRNGKNYGLSFAWTIGHNVMGLGIREDWMTKVGVSSVPKTLDEMESLLLKFRNEDPDGNGKKDTYGVGGSAGNVSAGYVFGAFGVNPNMNMLLNGKIVRGEVQPGVKDALTILNKWYKEQIIDPEFIVDTADSYDQKWYNGKLGSLVTGYYEMLPASWYFSGKYNDKLKAVNPTAKIAFAEPPKGPSGQQGINQSAGRGQLTCFGSKVDKTKMIRIMKMVDTISSDAKWDGLVYFGDEGVTYKKSDSGVDYIKPYDIADNRDKYGSNGFYSLLPDYAIHDPAFTNFKECSKVTPLCKGKWDILLDYPLEAMKTNGVKLNDLVTKNYTDFITGGRPISDFDKFVEEWRKAGGDGVEKEANDVYVKYFKK